MSRNTVSDNNMWTRGNYTWSQSLTFPSSTSMPPFSAKAFALNFSSTATTSLRRASFSCRRVHVRTSFSPSLSLCVSLSLCQHTHACTKCLNLFKGMVTFLQARLSLLLSAEICSHTANGFLFPALLFFQLKQSKPRLFCRLCALTFLFAPLLFVLHKISPHPPGLHFAVLLCPSPHV